MARVRPLGILLALLTFLTGLAAIAWVAVRDGRLAESAGVLRLEAELPTLAIALAATLFLMVAFRGGARRIARRHGERDLRSLSALESVAALVVVIVLLALTFGSFAGTILSLGLVGFGLTLALQRPILAVGGWIAILFTRLFRVGDRIEVDKMHGDVLEINLFNTRLWEVDGATGRPTGRVLSMSNAVFLEKPVANATADAPDVFDEFVVTVAYGSDVRAAEALLRGVGGTVIDAASQRQRAAAYARVAEELPIDAEFPDAPIILVTLAPGGIELRLRYLVDARRRSATRTALSEAWLVALGERAGEPVPRVGA